MEAAILISLGLVLIGIRPRLKETLVVASTMSLATLLIRSSISLPPGINVFIQLPILIILAARCYRLHLIHAFLASCLGLICIGLTETVFNILITKTSGISMEQALADPLWHLLFPMPEFVMLAGVTFVLLHYDLALFDIRELSNSKTVEHYEE